MHVMGFLIRYRHGCEYVESELSQHCVLAYKAVMAWCDLALGDYNK